MKRTFEFLKSHWGILFIATLSISFMLAEIINHRFWLSDYEVYHRAAFRLFYGNPLYKVHYEDPFYIYKYSPLAPVFFIPFIGFSLKFAKILYWLFLTAIIIASFIFGIKSIYPDQKLKSYNTAIVLGALILALHFLRELHLGQVNYLLFTLYVLVCYFYLNGNYTASMILLAITIFFKPFGLIFIPYLLVKKKLKLISILFTSLAVLFFIPFMFYPHWSDFINLYKGWFHELAVEMNHKQSLLQDGNHTIFSVLARYTPVRFLISSKTSALAFQIIMLIIIGVFFYIYQKADQKENKFIVNNFAFLIALIPLFSFTSENAFCFSGLAIISLLVNFKYLNVTEKVFSILGFLFIGGNFSEIVGKANSAFFDKISLISIGAIVILSVLYSLRMRRVM